MSAKSLIRRDRTTISFRVKVTFRPPTTDWPNSFESQARYASSQLKRLRAGQFFGG